MYNGAQMLDFIRLMINRFGPRKAGSESERKAQEYLQNELLKLSPKVRLDEFEDHLESKFGVLKLFVAVYIICLIVARFHPLYALFLSLVNSTFFLLDFVFFRTYLAFLFPRKKSCNLSAVLEPAGEVKRTVILSGHIDSTAEFTWWYKLKGTGLKLTIVAGALMALLPVGMLLMNLLPGTAAVGIWWFFALCSPLLITYWQMKSGEPTPGAQDNLSGISIAYHAFRSFYSSHGINKLKHTRLVFASFGCEECGLIGSQNYVRMRLEELKKQNAVIINFDSIRVEKEVTLVEKELMNGSVHSTELVSDIEKAFRQFGLPVKRGMIPIGGTDAVPFNRAGIPGISLIGISSKEFDFTYHTRDDLPEHIEEKALENVYRSVMHYIETSDR